jgi:hypothetical protein
MVGRYCARCSFGIGKQDRQESGDWGELFTVEGRIEEVEQNEGLAEGLIFLEKPRDISWPWHASRTDFLNLKRYSKEKEYEFARIDPF